MQLPDDGEADDTPMEEDAADVAARKRAAAKAREEAALRRRSRVCSCACARPKPACLQHACCSFLELRCVQFWLLLSFSANSHCLAVKMPSPRLAWRY